jgi:hypothetical protein
MILYETEEKIHQDNKKTRDSHRWPRGSSC